LTFKPKTFFNFNQKTFCCCCCFVGGWKKAFNWAREYALQTTKNKTEAATESQQ